MVAASAGDSWPHEARKATTTAHLVRRAAAAAGAGLRLIHSLDRVNRAIERLGVDALGQFLSHARLVEIA
jgi:hypothetical protein